MLLVSTATPSLFVCLFVWAGLTTLCSYRRCSSSRCSFVGRAHDPLQLSTLQPCSPRDGLRSVLAFR